MTLNVLILQGLILAENSSGLSQLINTTHDFLLYVLVIFIKVLVITKPKYRHANNKISFLYRIILMSLVIKLSKKVVLVAKQINVKYQK